MIFISSYAFLAHRLEWYSVNQHYCTLTNVMFAYTATFSVFMWGAKSGEEQLPPFPEPTHRGIRNRGQLGDKQQLLVDFPSEAVRQNALPVVQGQCHMLPD